MNIVNLITFVILFFTILGLLFLIIKSNVQKKNITAMYIQGELDKYSIIKKLEEVSNELSIAKLSESDGFIKFISQSRDWAFQYIEEVQSALKEFDSEVVHKFEWAKTYGIVTNGGTHSKVLNEISMAYEKLKSVLPENTETPNN